MSPTATPKYHPDIIVNGAQRLIDFLEAPFGRTSMQRFDRPDRSVMHATANIGGSVIMIAEADANHRAFPVGLPVYVPDVDEACGRAPTVVGEFVEEPKLDDRANDCCGAVRDPSIVRGSKTSTICVITSGCTRRQGRCGGAATLHL